eukprot:EG_transcript_19675
MRGLPLGALLWLGCGMAPGAALPWTRSGLPLAPLLSRGPQLLCMATKCRPAVNDCLEDAECHDVLACHTKCRPGNPYCFFMCEATYGAASAPYQAVADCMLAAGCSPPHLSDGKCRVAPTDGLTTERDLRSIEGEWWVVRGFNPHYDKAACQRNQYVQLPNGTWVNNVTYQPTHVEPPLQITAQPAVSVLYPGVYSHEYGGREQLENWVVVSRPRRHYMLVLWCGENPAMAYAGAVVLSPDRDAAHVPAVVEEEFREIAAQFGLNYDVDMAVSDNSQCPY